MTRDLSTTAQEIIRDDPALAYEVWRLIDRRSSSAQFSLTSKQRELLDFIRQFGVDNDGLSPSYAEMAEAVEVASKSGINRLINGLEERGAIRRLPGRTRAISIVEHAA